MEAHWRRAALHGYPVLHQPAATANVQQHRRLPAPCVPCPRAQEVFHAHTQSLGCKSPLCPSDTHLFFQVRKYHHVFCREHTPQPGTPTATPGWSTGSQLRAPTLPWQPAQPVWVGSPAPRQGRPACSTQHPAVHLRGSTGCCAPRGALPRGSSPAVGSKAASWLQLSLLVHAAKARPACLARMWFCPTGGQT